MSDISAKIQDAAIQEFDTCIKKHAKTVRNSLYTIIGHAYNEGFRNGAENEHRIKSYVEEPDEWIEIHTTSDRYSAIYYQHKCGIELFKAPYNYCPNCGKKMKKENT